MELGATLRVCHGTDVAGAATDADSTPTCVVLEQGTALGYAPTVTNKAVGLYEVEIVCSSGNGFEVGKEYSAYIVTVISGTTKRTPIAAFTVTAAGELTALYEAAGIMRRNTAQAGASSTITLDASASAADDFYNRAVIVILSGTGGGAAQWRVITDYVGSTKVATVDRAWTTNPDNTSVFLIVRAGGAGAAADVGSIATDALSAAAVSSAAAAKIATAVGALVVEGSDTLLDTLRGHTALIGGPATDFTTGTITFKSIDGATTRWTGTVDTVGGTGRLTLTRGDLTTP